MTKKEKGLAELQQEIHKSREKLKKTEEEINRRGRERIESLSIELQVSPEFLYNEREIAKFIKEMDKLETAGSKDAVKRKKHVLLAKTKMQTLLRELDKKRQKAFDDAMNREKDIKEQIVKRKEYVMQKIDSSRDLQRATAKDVRNLAAKVASLESKVGKVHADEKLWAKMTNLDSRIQVLDNQIQKILRLIKNANLDERLL